MMQTREEMQDLLLQEKEYNKEMLKQVQHDNIGVQHDTPQSCHPEFISGSPKEMLKQARGLDLPPEAFTPCIEPKFPLPPGLTPAQIQAMIDCITNATNTILANTPNFPQSQWRRTHRVTRGNMGVMEAAVHLAEAHPDTVNPTLDVAEWAESLNTLNAIAPLEDAIFNLNTVMNTYRSAESIIAFNDFLKYYKCVKILAADGLPEAIKIWQVIKVIYDHLRGKRGPICGIKEMNAGIQMANELIINNKPKLLGVLNNQKLLEENLKHAIHQEDDLLDEELHDKK